MDKKLEKIVQALQENFGSFIEEFRDEVHVFVKAEQIVDALTLLRDKYDFELLSALTAVDYWPQTSPRYHVIYLMLTNPMYAGIYAYGRRQTQVDPLAKSRQIHRKARADWEVFLPEHHVGYIRKAGIRSQHGQA